MGGVSRFKATKDRRSSSSEYSRESAGLIKQSATPVSTGVPLVTLSMVSQRLSPLRYKRDSIPGSNLRVRASSMPTDLAIYAFESQLKLNECKVLCFRRQEHSMKAVMLATVFALTEGAHALSFQNVRLNHCCRSCLQTNCSLTLE